MHIGTSIATHQTADEGLNEVARDVDFQLSAAVLARHLGVRLLSGKGWCKVAAVGACKPVEQLEVPRIRGYINILHALRDCAVFAIVSEGQSIVIVSEGHVTVPVSEGQAIVIVSEELKRHDEE